MKIHNDWGNYKKAGDEVSGFEIYSFFLAHMFILGGFIFAMSYIGDISAIFRYAFGALSIIGYIAYYRIIFGIDEIKWLVINTSLGFWGIHSQFESLLSFLGKRYSDYPLNVHIIPFIYFVMYTFLIRQAILDLTDARENPTKKFWIEISYIAIYVAFCML